MVGHRESPEPKTLSFWHGIFDLAPPIVPIACLQDELQAREYPPFSILGFLGVQR
jgi:hypothetical protein